MRVEIFIHKKNIYASKNIHREGNFIESLSYDDEM